MKVYLDFCLFVCLLFADMKNFFMDSGSESLIKYAMEAFSLIHWTASLFVKVTSADIFILMLSSFNFFFLIVSDFVRHRNLTSRSQTCLIMLLCGSSNMLALFRLMVLHELFFCL